MTKPSPAQGGSDGHDLATALAPHRDAILFQLGQTWRLRAPKNTVMLGDPQSAVETAESIGTAWFTWLENIHDLSSVRDLAIKLVRQGITYTTASALSQALAGIVTDLTAGDAQHEVTALKLTRHFSAAFLDQIATQHELQTQQEQERLAVQLKASAEVGRAAASILDTDQLLREVVNLITDRFGFYYTAVFTLDHTGQYAVLREATGQAGEVLKNLNHKLDIHGQSMVGAVITLRRPRVAAEVGRDVPRFSNPLLPETQSEIALPLSVGDRVLGALDVQSTEPRAFDETAVTVLQNMADQIAIALENARLFERAQANLRDSQTAQANLARNQAQLSDALKIANLSYWEYDIATDTFNFDEHAFVMLHTTPQQLGGYTLTGREFVRRFVHTADQRQARQLFRDASQTSDLQYTAQGEVRAFDVDGQLHWFVIRLRVAQDETGRISTLIGTNQDITDRKRAEAILSQSEAQLSDALRIAQLGYWEYDVARDVFLFNDQFYALFHTTAEAEGGYEMPSMRYAQKFVHPDDAAIVGGEIGAALQSTDPNYSRQIDHRMVYADGSLGYLTVRFRVERDADGRPVKFIGANEDITERKRAESALQQSEEKFRKMTSAARDSIIMIDDTGLIFFWNEAAEKMFGYSATEAAGQALHTLLAPSNYLPAFRAAFGNFARFGTGAAVDQTLELEARHRDGHVFPIELSLSAVELGNRWNALGLIKDITERKRAETILRENEARLSEALRIAQLGYWEYDVARDVFLFNDQFYALFHTTAEAEGGYEMPSTRYAQKFVHPDDAVIVGGEIGAALQSTDPNYSRQIDHRILYADGSLGYLTVRFRVERDANGHPIKFIGANEDISERKRAESALQRERGLLRGVIDSVPDLIFYKDTDGGYLGCNVAFEVFVGRSERELIGQTDHSLFPPDIAEFFREQDAQMLKQRTSRRNEEWVTYPDGRRVLLDTLKTPFYDEAGQVLGLIGISRDITARKQADSERERLLARSETLYHTSADLNAAHTYREVLEVLREHTLLGEADRNVSLNLFDKPWVNDEVPEWSITLDRWTTLPADAVRDRYPLRNYSAATLLRVDAPTIITDISTDARLDEAARQLYAVHFQGGSTVFVPLVASGQWIGFLNAVYSEPRMFSEEEIRVITSAAVQAGVVVQSIQRQAEVAESEARFRDVSLASADWVWEVNAQGTYTYCSERVIDVLGYSPDEVIGKTPFDFMPAAEAERVGPIFAQAIAAQQPLHDLENRNRTKDGREVILLTSGVPILSDLGELLGYRGVDEDITLRRQTELALAQERNILRTLIDNLPDFVFVKDATSHFVVNNVAHAGLFGSTPEAIRGKSDFDFFPPELAERYFADEQAIIHGGQPVIDMEEPSVDATGRPRWHLATKLPMRDELGQPIGLVGVVRDITIIKETAAERERLIAQQQKRTVQLQTASEVSRASSSILQLEELLTTVVELVRDRFNLYYVGAFLLDDDGRWAVLRAGTGEAGRKMLAAKHQLPIDETSMIGWTIVNQQARIALDVGQDAVRFNNPLLPNTRSEMALPLISRGRILGAATIQSTQPAAFTAEDVTVLQTMADQITTAAENARLFEQTQQTVRQMSALNDITSALSREIELVPVLEATYHSLQHIMSVDAFLIALYEAATNSVEYPLIYDEGQRYSQAAASLSPDSRVSRVIRTGEPILEHVSREEWQAMTTVANPVGNTSKPSASLLYVPLKRGEEVIGVLSVQSYQFNAYTREHTDLLSSVANQLAVAILNARLFEQTRRAVDELDALNRRLTGEAWQTYAQTRSPDAVIWHANDPDLTQLGQAQAEQLAAGVVAIQQAADDEVEVSIPITLRGQLIGALRFLVPAGKWTDESQSIAMSIAGHLAQAAENTRLIEQTQLIAQRDRAIATAAERIRRSTDINAILQAAVEEINRYTVTDGISLQIGFEAAAPNGARPKEQVEL